MLHGPTRVAGAANVGPNDWRPDIAAMATTSDGPTDLQYCVVWETDGDVKGQRYDALGTIGGAIDVASGPDEEVAPSVGAGACEFTVAYGRRVGISFAETLAARVLADGTVATRNVLVDTPASPSEFIAQPRASSRPLRDVEVRSNRCFVAYDRSLFVSGANVYNVRAAVFENVGATTSPFGVPCPGPLGEMPTIGTAGLPYPGTDDFTVLLTNAPMNTLAVLVISDTFASFPIPGAPGCTAYLGLPLVTALPTVTGAGAAAVTFDVPCGVPNGSALAMQWLVWTPGHNAFGWIVSDDLDVFWDH